MGGGSKMPALNWDKFLLLEGSKDKNFENLCRGIVRLQFGRFGQFRALSNQPGVEFYLPLTQSCRLGAPPKCIGWQCKFHQRTQTGNFKAASRRDIENSLSKTEKFFPEITDWILWTPYTLSKRDQEWFYNLTTKMKLALWDKKDLDDLLNGDCLLLRAAYFDELIITQQNLKEQHKVAVQPIFKRWLEPAHQSVDSERTIRRMLGESSSWAELVNLGQRLKEAGDIISHALNDKDHLNNMLKSFVVACGHFSDTLLHFHEILDQGDLDIIQQKLKERKTLISAEVRSFPRQLRKRNLSIMLNATNALDDMRIAQELLNEIEDFLGVGLVALLADAGGGKTHLAAELTKPNKSSPAGVLFLGRDLHKGQTLDDLAHQFSINGNPLTSMERLLASLDATGKRSGHRLPVLIDGLNEAENPRDWKDSLARLNEVVRRYPNVLVVCTLRTGEHRREDQRWLRTSQTDNRDRESFAVMALPEGVRRIESEGFGGDVDEAIDKYFKHFKINPGEADIPVGLFQNPLTLRIFCEVNNPKREAEVKVDYFPASLSLLLEKYIEKVCERIAEMPNRSHPYTVEDVKVAIYKLGLEMWKARHHEISEKAFRVIVSDSRDWGSSIVNLLAQEGIIFRNPGDELEDHVIIPAYDALGGYLIASALLIKHKNDSRFTWFNKKETIESFRGENSHSLAVDIFKSLVSLVPRRMYGKQLWKEKIGPFRNAALRFIFLVEPGYIDKDSVSELFKLLSNNPKERANLFHSFQGIRGATKHPLNAAFLDTVLRSMTVVDRDLSWTEWIRKTRRERFSDLVSIERRWKTDLAKRTISDRLRAKWVMWLLASVDRELRDVATRALYWFGRGDPQALLEESIRALDINDLYVPERLFAASYGVVMALHYENKFSFNQKILCPFAKQIYKSMFAKNAKYGTTHILLRDYAKGIADIALLHEAMLFSESQKKLLKPPFVYGGIRSWGQSVDLDDDKYRDGSAPLHMDFENYTLGRLVEHRNNYDFKNSEYQIVRANMFWRIYDIGYTHEAFKDIDSQISWDNWNKSAHIKVDRYGKKYCWIAFYELAGFRQDNGLLSERYTCRISDTDIDPSFPDEIKSEKIIKDDFLSGGPKNIKDWIKKAPMPKLKPYLNRSRISKIKGPWILLEGYITQENYQTKKNMFTFARGFFITKDKKRELLKALRILAYPGNNRLPDAEDDYYTFAGEIPWRETYPHQQYKKQIEVPTGEKNIVREKIETTQKVLEIDYGDKKVRFPVYSEENIKKGFIEREEEKILSFDVEVSVRNFCWESGRSIVNPGHGAYILTKEICEFLNLTSRPQTFDMYDGKNKIASIIRSFGDLWHNGHKLIYIRQDLLNNYLKKKELDLIWVIWGERRFCSKDDKELREFAKKNKSYQVYKEFLAYKG